MLPQAGWARGGEEAELGRFPPIHKYCRDVEDELQWIKERKPLADSNELRQVSERGAEQPAEEAPGNVCVQAIVHFMNHCYDYM